MLALSLTVCLLPHSVEQRVAMTLSLSCPETGDNKHAGSLALAITTLPWKWREDHMAAPVVPVMSCSRG